MENLDYRIVAAAITAFASIGVFFGGRFFALLADRAKAKSNRNALVSAVYTEIKHNVEDLKISLPGIPSDDVSHDHFQSRPNGNVLIVYSRNMVFFDLLQGEMTALPIPVLERAVRFYSHLEKVYQYADSVSGETFRNISIRGKVGVLRQLRTNIDEARICGEDALEAFRNHFGRAVLGPIDPTSPKVQDHSLRNLQDIVVLASRKIA